MPDAMAAINLRLIMPEIVLSVGAFLILLLAPIHRKRATSGIAVSISLLAIVVAAWVVAVSWNRQETGYYGMVISDNFALFCKAIFLLTLALGVLLSRNYLIRNNIERPEYYALMLLSGVGMMIMVATTNLVVMFLGLEVMSIPLYVLAGFMRTNLRSNESAAKYFFMGAFASAFLLYGVAMVYGATGHTDLRQVYMALDVAMQNAKLYLISGGALILVGFAFKIASFPFHMWVPDVYQGAPTPVTAFFSIGPKAAGVAALLRVFSIGMHGMESTFTPIFWLLAFFTMTVGNLLAVMQDDVKRMLAYSSIAHAGYLLVALTAGGDEAVSAALFYLLAYGFFNMGAFTIVTIVENRTGGSNQIDTYKGLASKHPWLAVFLALFMFSLAGFPPTAGFFAKFYVFSAAVNAGFVWLVIAAVLNSLISVYYYLRPVKAAFFQSEEEGVASGRIAVGPLLAIVLLVTVLGSLALGLIPGHVLDWAMASVFTMM